MSFPQRRSEGPFNTNTPATDVPNTALLACIETGVVAITAAGLGGVIQE
jgi:hypothetical protein